LRVIRPRTCKHPATAKRSLREDISREVDISRKGALQAKLSLLERGQERVDEACVMF